MSQDRDHLQPEQPGDQPKDRDRREAMQRLATYTAPAMLALLMSEKAVAQTTVSDARLKRDIARVGSLPNGLGLYRYRYLWSDTAFVGVMAQEAAVAAPEAVRQGPNGYLHVDYARLGTRLQTWEQWAPPAAFHREGERVAA
jgi:hypothetical protein